MSPALVVVGGGNMGAALVSGLLSRGWTDMVVVERLAERRSSLGGQFPSGTVALVSEIPPAGGAVIAVKPHDVEAVCRQLAVAGVARVLSIAAGVTLSRDRKSVV